MIRPISQQEKVLIEAMRRTAEANGYTLRRWLVACGGSCVIDEIRGQAEWVEANKKWQEHEDMQTYFMGDVK
jgi:uncharacterized protein CbrC (UPF0167 family)